MINIPVQYAYLSLSLAVGGVWLALFFLSPSTRRRQLLLSSIFAAAGPMGELFYIPDYWHPVTVISVNILQSYISIEDFIFGFAIMGIMSSLPTLVVKPRLARDADISLRAIATMALGLAVVAILSLVFWLFGLNSIFATSLAMVSVAAVILVSVRRRILTKISAVGAVGMVAVMFAIYWSGFFLVADSDSILRATWSLYDTTLGVRILRVPLPELVWAFSFGGLFSVLFALDRVVDSP